MNVEEIEWSVRTYACLKFAGIDTVEQLRSMSDDQILRIKRSDKKMLEEIRKKVGLSSNIHTIADRVRTMSDEELARFLTWNVPDCANYCDDARCGCKWNCKHGGGLRVIKDWLKQPVKEDA